MTAPPPLAFTWDGEAESLRLRLLYDPETGLFTWRPRPCWAKDSLRWNKRYAGTTAGSPNKDGYVHIKIDGRLYGAHRLAWLIVHGTLSAAEIDHRNGDRADNRISNLREATRRQQMHNLKRPATNTSGFKGASFHKRAGRWAANIHHGGRARHLGYFDTVEAAHAAYVQAAVSLRGEFARVV